MGGIQAWKWGNPNMTKARFSVKSGADVQAEPGHCFIEPFRQNRRAWPISFTPAERSPHHAPRALHGETAPPSSG